MRKDICNTFNKGLNIQNKEHTLINMKISQGNLIMQFRKKSVK